MAKQIFYIFAMLFLASLVYVFTASLKRPTAQRAELLTLLENYDRYYDSADQMLQWEFDSPGYHSQIRSGTLVHPTRESLIYALALLKRNGDSDNERAIAIVRRVLPLQDTSPTSRTYGVWPWLLEEPLDQMDAPDLNWADFCGIQIAHLLVKYRERFPEALSNQMQTSLRHAANAIRRRDVQPGYTNIAILGGSVCVRDCG